MIKVGITGQVGFMGTHLFNYLNTRVDIQTIPFEDRYFDNKQTLTEFVQKCDVIVHLAAMNRHPDDQVIYNTNITLVEKLIVALEANNSIPNILFSSSTQEEKDNAYGRSKKEGRKMLEQWAKRSGGRFTGMIIPNVFGPFGKPFYNSVVPTFCHQLIHDEKPKIIVDGSIKFVYINDLVQEFYNALKAGVPNPYKVPQSGEIMVTELLKLLEGFKENYLLNGIIPDLTNPFEKSLFNTFRCFIPYDHYPVMLTEHKDSRGAFVEVVKAETPGQYSFSTTRPGITRGNHFHTRKAERFIVIQGRASIQLRKVGTEKVIEYELSGDNPAFVDMPVWYTHNITNIGDDDLLTLFWINEPYDPNDSDTFFEEV